MIQSSIVSDFLVREGLCLLFMFMSHILPNVYAFCSLTSIFFILNMKCLKIMYLIPTIPHMVPPLDIRDKARHVDGTLEPWKIGS